MKVPTKESFPTTEQSVLDDKTISAWVKLQLLETRKKDTFKVLADVEKLKAILERRVDRQIKESKTFKTVTDLNAIDFD